MNKTFVEKLTHIQSTLKAPKSQYNKFGQYNYRNQEDILEAVKPLLAEAKFIQTISDEMVEIGGRVYVKATVTVTDGESTVSNSAYAREPQDQKGMNEAQITGSASSYARKYALNGMYAIDDTKDADATNTHGKEAPAKETPKAAEKKAEAPKQEAKKEAPKQEAPKTSRFAPKNAPVKETPKQQETVVEDDGWS